MPTPGRTPRTPKNKGTPKRPTSSRKTPRTPSSQSSNTPGRRRGRSAADQESDQLSDVVPLPSSPTARPPSAGFAISELDLSSPLNYGTPSSSIMGLQTPRSGSRGTPIRHRSDLRSDRRIRQVNVAPETASDAIGADGPPSTAESVSAPQLVIWGTDVAVQRCKDKFRHFIQSFRESSLDEDERMDDMNIEDPYYEQRLQEIHVLETAFLNLNCCHLKSWDSDLYRQLVCYPQEVIPTFDMAVNEMFFDKYPDDTLQHQIQVRPYNAEKTKNMRSLNPEDIDQLITISGMVIRNSGLVPEMREAWFQCTVCRSGCAVELDRGRIAEPTVCSHCNSSHSFQIIHNRSQFTDKQMVKLQESPDDMPPGQTPHTVILYAHNDLVDSVQPGDRVTVTGIYRAQPMRVNPRMRNVKSVYRTHIDVLHFRKIDNRRLRGSCEEGKDGELSKRFPAERVEILKELSKKPDIYERLARAIAPSIYENEDVKKGILLQLFGGTKKDFSNTGRGKFRSEINILLCGDPGTSKSQLLQYVYNLVPRSQYTSGKGSSAVGLTAYVTKDPETRQLVLQTGALVLADNGICCIDEFDKMSEATRSVLHEVMEQQTLSIAKAGIICQLNARTSVLAAANPLDSQWNKNKTIVENIQLPHTLLSRFDLIFLILDPGDEAFDRRLARHLVALYYRTEQEDDEENLDMSVLRDYIAYAKEHVNPQLSDEASQKLIQVYVDMRKVGSGRGQISAYPRQLESLIRLAEAHAKLRYSKDVEVVDVEEAWRLYREALKQSATDPISGKIDVSILTTGLSSAARRRRQEVANALKQIIQGKGKVTTIQTNKLLQELKDSSELLITREMFEDALKDLQDDEVLVQTGRTIRVLH